MHIQAENKYNSTNNIYATKTAHIVKKPYKLIIVHHEIRHTGKINGGQACKAL